MKAPGPDEEESEENIPDTEKSICEGQEERKKIWCILEADTLEHFVRRVYVPRFFISSQQRFGMMDIKAPSACHSSQVLDDVIALRTRMDHVIALRQISVTALFYLEDSRKIHLQGARAC